MQFLTYAVDVSVYCFFLWLCSILIFKELGFDYWRRKEISTLYAVGFLPFLIILLGISAVNTIHIATKFSQIMSFLKLHYPSLVHSLTDKVYIWTGSVLAIVIYIILKSIYHIRLKYIIEKRNNKILEEIEGNAVVDVDSDHTPNHIEYL